MRTPSTNMYNHEEEAGKEVKLEDTQIFRSRKMASSKLETIPSLPAPDRGLATVSFDLDIDMDIDEVDTKRRRAKQVSDLTTMTSASSSEESDTLAFLKNAFVSAPMPHGCKSPTFDFSIDHDTTKHGKTPLPRDIDINKSRRIKQVSNITAMTADVSDTGSKLSGMTITPTSTNNPGPADMFVEFPALPSLTSNPSSADMSVEVPALPSLTANSFEEKEQYRGFHRSLKVRLNKMAKLHYFRTKSK